MTRYLNATIVFALLLLPGCSTYTNDPLIVKPSELPRECIGEWVTGNTTEGGYSSAASLNVSESATEESNYIVKLSNDNINQPISWTVVAKPCHVDGRDIRLIQLTRETEPTSKFSYFYVELKKKSLIVWSINTEEWIKLIKGKRINSVIDRRKSDTEIIADPSKLLELLVDNFDLLSTKKFELHRKFDVDN